jgi:hypothetical protein
MQALLEADDVGAEKQLLRKRCREFSAFIRSALQTRDTDDQVAIAAVLRCERVKRAVKAVGENFVCEQTGKLVASAAGIGPAVAQMMAQIMLSVFKIDIVDATRSHFDRRWPGLGSTRDFYSQMVRPFRSTLCVRRIDRAALARSPAPSPS